MRAVVYRGVNDLRVETVPVPRIGPDELLVKVAACGVCPTDIKKIRFGTVPPPRIFGHETAGVVVQAGRRLKKFHEGDRVALHHHVPCMGCHACRHRSFAQCPQYKRTGITAGFEPAGGGYAEYVRVMSFVLPGVVRIPASNSFIEAAMLEPVNTVLKAIHRLAVLPGDTILVVGQGPIGLMFTRLLALRGMNVAAADLLKNRLKLAKEFGARWTFKGDDPKFCKKMMRLSKGRGVDAAVVAVPSDQATLQALEAIRGAGQVMLFAHTRRGTHTRLDLSAICVDEKDVIGSYSSDLTLQREVARLVFTRKLDVRKLVSNQFPLERTMEAVELAANPKAGCLKIVITPGN